jgi:hypothetical protein
MTDNHPKYIPASITIKAFGFWPVICLEKWTLKSQYVSRPNHLYGVRLLWFRFLFGVCGK